MRMNILGAVLGLCLLAALAGCKSQSGAKQEQPSATETAAGLGESQGAPTPEQSASGSASGQANANQCGWKITFSDDFNSNNLDTTRWKTDYKSGDQEAQYYVNDAFELQDGILKIRAEERQVNDRKYASGILTTQGIFDQRYGRFEVRAKVPSGKGLWPAFWLLPATPHYPNEIDVFEILGYDPHTVYMTNHWEDEAGQQNQDTVDYKGPDFSQDYHIFEMRWSPDEIVWMVDKKERARVTRGIPQEPMFLLLNLAVGGKWPGYPDAFTPFPSYMEVDYVRVYQSTCP